jgi:penicillin-binding protein 1A
MQNALKAFPEQKRAPPPEGLVVEGGNMYFSEFPPGQAIMKLGTGEKNDSLGDFLNNIETNRPNPALAN